MPVAQDLTGRRFGRLTVVVRRRSGGVTKYGVRCDCGAEAEVLHGNLTRGHTTSCGCLQRERSSQAATLDLTGATFGRLSVLERSTPPGADCVRYRVHCECGREFETRGEYLSSGSVRSCGCLRSEVSSGRRLVDISGSRFGMLTALRRASNRGTRTQQYLVRCDCGSEKVVDRQSLVSGSTRSCGCATQSHGARAVRSCLETCGVAFTTEHRIAACRHRSCLPFDFAVWSPRGALAGLIEYNGIQHYEYTAYWHATPDDFDHTRLRDGIKLAYCQAHSIPLLVIPYWEECRVNELVCTWLQSLPES